MLQFDVSRTVALLPIVLYTAGFCLGPLIAAPFSEVYGRRIIYWTNLPMLVIFNAIAAASNNIVVLILFRFLAGVGGSGVLAVGAGIDLSFLYKGSELTLFQVQFPIYGNQEAQVEWG
jgi:MFS family permease